MTFRCDHCREAFEAPKAQRGRGTCKHIYCGKRCTGLARRVPSTKAQRRANKAAYDKAYREATAEKRKANHAEWFRRTYSYEKGKAARRARREEHRRYIAAYNADPANKAAKQAYDLALRAAEYGPFADAWRILLDLEREIRRMVPDKYERLKARGYYDRENAQRRRRNAQISRW